ncbi:MEIOTIC F-BOX protein MOF [Triticum aestivum]|uniref:MEIOTIC F-BOX protein MOF n=1 Tax=Triticum aestivum TaxID=4565 RepID=UPI001D028687|nr:MEIOTIC F-BOX protein MOF-like [Triticum aestivum]
MEVSRKAKRAGGGFDDRLSDLPDCLLHDILSRLKARQVVQTCVLSRRWQHLWPTCPCLDVDIGEFRPDATLSPHPWPPTPAQRGNYGKEPQELADFEDFANSLLVHRIRSAGAAPLQTLRLRIPPCGFRVLPIYGSEIYAAKYTRWVRRGLQCSPAALDVRGSVTLPPLASHRLTSLRLDQVILHRDFAEHLASGLPVLEDLQITGTMLSAALPRIASGTLKNLVVESSTHNSESLTFTIAAPRLASLHLAVNFQCLIYFAVVLEEAPCLVQASVRLVGTPDLRHKQGDGYYLQHDRDLLRALCNFIGSLSHVCTLKLHGFGNMTVVEQPIPHAPPPGAQFFQHQPEMLHPYIPLVPPPGPFFFPDQPPMPAQPLAEDKFPCPMLHAMLDEEHHGLPVFRSMRTLVLEDSEIGGDAQTLWRFLHNAPLLEKLTLKNCQCHDQFPNTSMMELLPRTISLTPNLKSVAIIEGDSDGSIRGANERGLDVHDVR